MEEDEKGQDKHIGVPGDLEKTDWEPEPSWFINGDKETFNLRNNTGNSKSM